MRKKLDTAVKEIYREINRGDGRLAFVAENRFIIDMYYRQARSGLYGHEKTEYDNALFDFLKAKKFDVTASDTESFLKLADVDDGFLYVLHQRIVFACITQIRIACAHKNGDEARGALSLLGKSADFDYGRIYTECSKTEKLLLTHEVYRISDEKTREVYRSLLKKYAKKNGIGTEEAARSLLYEDADAVLFENESKLPRMMYFPAVIFVFAVLMLLCCVAFDTFDEPLTLIPVFLLSFSFYECAKFLVDYTYSKLFYPKRPMRTDSKSIDEKQKTLIVITSLLNGFDSDSAVFGNLEDICLSNRESIFSYGILADLCDSDSLTHGSDELVIKNAKQRVDELNKKYGNRFYLFFRDREYSAVQEKFIVHERKRGAVIELVKKIYNGSGAVETVCGEPEKLLGTKYVITLDSDTKLPPGEGMKAVCCAAHPHNTPTVDEKTKTVVSGHGIFQPNISTCLESGAKTGFSLLTSGGGGFDSYANASYETYAQVFGEANFCGKGIFDVECFYKCIPDAFCDGVILSHDLLEGMYLRCGALNDVTLYDNTPSGALAYFKRESRWIRGDVQSLTRIFSRVKNRDGKKIKNPLSLLSKYKLFDNVRRALTPLFSFAAFLAALLFSHRCAAATSVFSVFYIILPTAVTQTEILFFASGGVVRSYYSFALSSFWRSLFYMFCRIAQLPKSAMCALSSVCFSCRALASGKHLLDWVSAASAETLCKDLPGAYMLSYSVSLITGISVSLFVRCGLYRFFGLLFIASPFVMFALSLPDGGKEKKEPEFKEKAEKYAADCFGFFEKFVTSEVNYLPPDNYSEVGREPIAYRTSPTNIGMYMLSCLCACDFGIIDVKQLDKKLSDTLDTVEKLKKYEGNLYNWYDIRTLETLSDFVSSVDSGNFAVCLTALSAGLAEYGLNELKNRVDKLNENCKLSALYDRKKQLFVTGVNVGRGMTPSHYDIYMSEARSMYYYASARGEIPAYASGMPARILLSRKGRIGMGSWSGTCFEYFMPTLLLPVYKNSLLWEGTEYALWQQTENGTYVDGTYIFGISESCYYEFDSEMNYQYKAHGIPTLSLRYSPYADEVISPYSSFLMMSFAPQRVFENLERLEVLGCLGDFGFYEAMDCSDIRTMGGETVRCYMSHHVGMSMCALANYRFDGIVRRRFMSDPLMRAHRLMLAERVAVDETPFRPSDASARFRSAIMPEGFSNGEYSVSNGVLSNTKDKIFYSGEGTLYLESGDISITRKDRCETGFRFAECRDDGTVILPCDFEKQRVYDGRVEFSSKSTVLTAYPHRSRSAFCFKVESENPSALCFEPVLCNANEYIRHVSFSRLFVYSEMKDGILTFGRKGRDRKGYYLSFTVCDGEGNISDFKYQTVFERILPSTPAEADFARAFDGELYDRKENRKEACVEPYLFCRCDGKQYYAVMTVGCDADKTRKELCEIIGSVSYVNTGAHITSALCGNIGDRILYGIMNPHREKSRTKEKNGLDVSDLWKYGISGEGNVFLIDLRNCPEHCEGICEYVKEYFAVYKRMLVCGVRYTVAILYISDGYEDSVRRCVNEAVKLCGVSLLVGEKNGIIMIPETDEVTSNLILDSAFCTVTYPSTELSARPAELSVADNGQQKSEIERIKSFVYASKTFGTVVTRRNLGFTFYKNSHFGKITEFHGDSMNCRGETVYLCLDSGNFDLCKNADITDMDTDKTLYSGKVGGVRYTVTVSLHPLLPMKKVRVETDGEHTVMYRARFLLSETEKTVNSLSENSVSEKLLTVENVYSNEKYKAFLYCKNAVETKFDGQTAHMRAMGKTSEFVLGAYESEKALKHCTENSLCDFAEYYKESVEELCSVFMLKCADGALEKMFNEMSLYQAYYCRMLARCGFYQNGGAHGFRDQLQDSLCVLYVKPEETARQIYRCARRQYEEGDVMHWFHIEKEVGVRTRCSDDLLWLVYAVYRYVDATGDTDILSRGVYYIKSSPLASEEDDRYEKAVRSDVKESIYMHCVRAVERSLHYGKDGLPLFGSGDWNDGMNRVEGQSVWLAWFLCDVLEKMSELAKIMSDREGKRKYKAEAEKLRASTESFAFNGRYYIRGTYGNGEVIGERGGCNIDILPQAFAAFTGKKGERIRSALNEAYERLYDKENKLVKLLTPAFDLEPDAGYISHYPQGLRENGGQYTHGAVWLAAALLKAGENARGYEILRAINPSDRLGDENAKKRYGGEEYVFSGDVYTATGHVGRSGWSWYTGAAGWYFQTVLRGLLGYEEHGCEFTLEPHLCSDFSEFELNIDKHGTVYRVKVRLSNRDVRLLDGKKTEKRRYMFDGKVHRLELEIKE